MTLKSHIFSAGVFALLTLPSAALAQSVAVAPFVPNGVDAKIAGNITALASSEMDFMSEYDGAEELGATPGMNQWCLDNPGCMATVGRQASADQLLGGMVSPSGGDSYALYLVLFDVNKGTYVRKQSFTVATSPEILADSVGGFLKTLVTGVSPAAAAAAVAGASADEFDDFADEEDSFEFAPTVSHTVGTPGNSLNSLDDFEDPELAAQEAADRQRLTEEAAARDAAAETARRAEEETRRRAAEETRRRAEEQARLAAEEQARLAAEEQARLAAEEDARRRAEEQTRLAADEQARRDAQEQARRDEQARAAAAATAAADAAERQRLASGDDITFGSVDPNDIEVEDIQFGSAADLIAVEDADSGATFSGRSSARTSDYNPPAERTRSSSDYLADLDGLDDAPAESSRDRDSARSRQSSVYDGPSTEVASSDRGDKSPLTIAARGGYSRYQSLDFVSYGGEIGIPLLKSLYLRMGAEAFSVKREIPAEYQEIGGPTTTWETILPIGFGLSYQRTATNIRPYVGGDLTITPYTADFKVAPGFRVRAGSDFMVVDNFGFNINLAAGFWYGADLAKVAADMSAAGLVPQISAGTIFAF